MMWKPFLKPCVLEVRIGFSSVYTFVKRKVSQSAEQRSKLLLYFQNIVSVMLVFRNPIRGLPRCLTRQLRPASGSSFVTLTEESGEGRSSIRSCKVVSGGHTLVSDVEASKGGADLGMSPKQLLMSGLASCTAMTIRSVFAFKKQKSAQPDIWRDAVLDEITVKVSEHGDHPHVPSGFSVEISLHGKLSKEAKDQLLKASGNCPVKKIISGGTPIESTIV